MNCYQCGNQLFGMTAVCPRCGAPLRTAASHQAPPALGDNLGMRILLPVGRSPWAIAAGYAGLFAVTCFLAPIALLLGGIAIYDLRRHPDRHGWGRTIFGTVMGAIGTLLLVFAIYSAGQTP